MKLTSELKFFTAQHENENVYSLALQARKFPDIDINLAIRQIVGRRIAKEKIPGWYANPNIVYPAHLPLEQCSSEATALYKARHVSAGNTMLDLTGGMGIDISFMAKNFKQAIYVERQTKLSEIAKHNFKALGLENIRVINADSVKYLAETESVDLIYIDPARRNSAGKKTVSLEDCSPNIPALEKLLEQKARTVMVKLSPMLDISLALKSLKNVSDVHIIAVNNEMKELVLIIQNSAATDVLSHCVNIQKNRIETYAFNWEDECQDTLPCSSTLGQYLYEPNAAIMKGGAYKSIARTYALQKLHPNSHLYTSDEFSGDFPGRKFVVKDVCSLNNIQIKQANITVRNFPLSVAEIRKRTGLKEGGNVYIFATTLADRKKILVITEKITAV